MGWDPQSEKFRELTPEEARTFTQGPVFYVGEEVELKGLIFIVVDIAPAQIKLKPKRSPQAQIKEAQAELAGQQRK